MHVLSDIEIKNFKHVLNISSRADDYYEYFENAICYNQRQFIQHSLLYNLYFLYSALYCSR